LRHQDQEPGEGRGKKRSTAGVLDLKKAKKWGKEKGLLGTRGGLTEGVERKNQSKNGNMEAYRGLWTVFINYAKFEKVWGGGVKRQKKKNNMNGKADGDVSLYVGYARDLLAGGVINDLSWV